MQILGIESASLVASVALWKDDVLMGEYTVNHLKTHSQTLLPMMDEMVAMLGVDLQEIDAIALSNGPGSFTGLRIGSATAKGLGLALHKPVLEIPTVDAMAYQCFGLPGMICPIMDARRSQVYNGLYRFEDGNFQVLEEARALSVEALIAELQAKLQVCPGEKIYLLGDGVPVYGAKMKEALGNALCILPSFMSRQRAGALAALGAQYLERGQAVEASASAPNYLRKSQAEREMEERCRQ